MVMLRKQKGDGMSELLDVEFGFQTLILILVMERSTYHVIFV